ncbi:Flavonol synthase/flavanone 3-hydroxylase [Penicillium digitatum PHI26]|uniref:Flavonol synthase/flavanone 3-hydroxylase n=2 Tax=Penicillium digitatum TaxID=36651 RepID=K9F9W6_PEND2|nr:Flavonol synthase/flavanone 3-hydroxylase [Penicillium digitatum Pd1]EKV05914.1 Flavonol synthase/flavanone 3-hydroxylase [Penicillium digitatum PHI26]EKV17842.1 Flavonol synthase/flavanone 3-hydroxylase [Penicillium digitatum Pd1]
MTTLLEYTQIELLTLTGPEFRRVSTAPPRPPTEDEIPIIDLASIDKDLEARKTLASKVRAAAESTGFFYIKNHGISEELIQNALSQAKAFFAQPIEKKQLASRKIRTNADGWHGLGTTQINRTETRDRKETFSLRYNRKNDPTVSDGDTLSSEDDFAWDTTSHLPGFQETTVEFYQRRLTLARKMIRVFALALDMPEDYFDAVTTNPGADGLYVHYPATAPDALEKNNADVDVGIGSHTDIQFCLPVMSGLTLDR